MPQQLHAKLIIKIVSSIRIPMLQPLLKKSTDRGVFGTAKVKN